jgi:hypothetical protein
MQGGIRSALWKIPGNTKVFRLIDLKVTVIIQGSRAAHWGCVREHGHRRVLCSSVLVG